MNSKSSTQKQIDYFLKLDCTAKETRFSNDCTQSTKNPTFFYCHRQGILTDIFNVWRKQEEPENFSRQDIARAYRLGKWF